MDKNEAFAEKTRKVNIRSNIPEIRSKRQSTFSGGNNGSDRKNMILVWSDFLLVLLPKIRS